MTDRNDIKKIVLLLTIGLCDAITDNVISISEAEHYLFSPHTMRLMSYDDEVRDIIHLCTEFENLAKLVPSALDEAIADVKKRAKCALQKAAPCDYQRDSWLDKLM